VSTEEAKKLAEEEAKKKAEAAAKAGAETKPAMDMKASGKSG
jgi:hypothetical protein